MRVDIDHACRGSRGRRAVPCSPRGAAAAAAAASAAALLALWLVVTSFASARNWRRVSSHLVMLHLPQQALDHHQYGIQGITASTPPVTVAVSHSQGNKEL